MATGAPSPPGPAPKSKPRKHWLDYLQVFAQLAAVIVGTWWAIHSANQQRIMNVKNEGRRILREDAAIQKGDETAQTQRRMAEAQVGSSLLTWFKCEGSPQRSMARQMLKDVSPEQSHTAEYVLLLECKNPRDRELAEKYVLQSSLAEQRQDFLHTLGVARQYRSVGDHEKAAQEYDIAYNELPESFHSKKVALIAQKAREAFDNRDFRTASDLFEEAFSMIATH